MPEKKTETILNTLYMKVEYVDNLQERITEIAIQLGNLENERKLYEGLELPELFEKSLHSISIEEKSLTLEKSLLEDRMDEVDLDETLELISQYESKSNNI